MPNIDDPCSCNYISTYPVILLKIVLLSMQTIMSGVGHFLRSGGMDLWSSTYVHIVFLIFRYHEVLFPRNNLGLRLDHTITCGSFQYFISTQISLVLVSYELFLWLLWGFILSSPGNILTPIRRNSNPHPKIQLINRRCCYNF